MHRMCSLLSLQSRSKDFVWVRRRSCADFAKKRRCQDAERVVRCGFVGRLAHFVASEAHLEVFVQRKLNGHVGQAQKRRGQTRVESPNSFTSPHLASRIEGVVVLPWRSDSIGSASRDLRHESCLDDPDGIRGKSGACSGSDGSVYPREPFVLFARSAHELCKTKSRLAPTNLAVVELLRPVVDAHVDCPGG